VLNERVELNALARDALIERIESKLEDYGLEKVIPGNDLLEKTYRAFHRSQRLGERFKEMQEEFDQEAAAVEIPIDLEERIREVIAEHDDLRWDDAIQLVLDETQLDHVRAEKQEARKKRRLHGRRRKRRRVSIRSRPQVGSVRAAPAAKKRELAEQGALPPPEAVRFALVERFARGRRRPTNSSCDGPRLRRVAP
jgi:hypothetical protein